MFDTDLAELAPAEQLSALGQFRLGRNRMEVRILEGILAFADNHPEPRPSTTRSTGDLTAPGGDDPIEGLPGMERLKVYGGEGCPPVGEFVAADLGAVLEMSSTAAAGLLGDALGLRHRLPRVWARVLAGEARAWRACRIARATAALPLEAVAIVDAKVEKIIDRVGPDRLKNIVNGAMWQADPERAQAQAEELARSRGVWVGRSDSLGTNTLFVRAATGDVIQVDATIQALADALKALGDPDPVDRRRAKAIGWLADPADAIKLLHAARHLATNPPHPAERRAPQPSPGERRAAESAPGERRTAESAPGERRTAGSSPRERRAAESAPGGDGTGTGSHGPSGLGSGGHGSGEHGPSGHGSGRSRSGQAAETTPDHPTEARTDVRGEARVSGHAGHRDDDPAESLAGRSAESQVGHPDGDPGKVTQKQPAEEEVAREEQWLRGAGWQLAADGWDQSYIPDSDQRGLDEPPPVEEPPPPDDLVPDGHPSPDGPMPGDPLRHVPLPDVPLQDAPSPDAPLQGVPVSDGPLAGLLPAAGGACVPAAGGACVPAAGGTGVAAGRSTGVPAGGGAGVPAGGGAGVPAGGGAGVPAGGGAGVPEAGGARGGAVWEGDEFRRGSLSSRLAEIKDSARTGEARAGAGAARVEVKVHLSAEDLAALARSGPHGEGAGGSGDKGGRGRDKGGRGRDKGGRGDDKGGGVMRVEGVGPVLASLLKEVLGHDKVVLKPVIDLRERVSVDAHEIPARIRERVLLRDLYCVFPWCNRRATPSMDLDHVVPYRKDGPPGQTSTDKLAPECRYHHRLKTHGGWNCVVLTEGTYQWTSPEGARFVVDHTGTRAVDDEAADAAMDAVMDAAMDSWVLSEVESAAGGHAAPTAGGRGARAGGGSAGSVAPGRRGKARRRREGRPQSGGEVRGQKAPLSKS
ncbi:hypothetical protein OG394_07905 [Kribbella sp. NBC_01245]|uniref:hypothetical protein n=1 Tax=Kribbella sp. NBC_01245 TaxID=2903578 RepID=UPI002E2CA3E0|nr:hypothetical protein [Kribbella sp. NBC_01245]